MPQTTQQTSRLSELDWLRVILIVAVFVHHCFMPFNGDGWHIMNADSSKVLDDIMVYFEQLRLPSLFFIAGAGSFILLSKLRSVSFLKAKALRLLLPFTVGVLLVVPPQTYFENIAQYRSLISAFPTLMLEFKVNHLWFIEYLLIFMLLAIAIKPLISSIFASQSDNAIAKRIGLKSATILIALMLAISRVIFEHFFPEDNAFFISEISNIIFYLSFFIIGMVFVAHPVAWRSFSSNRRFSLYCFITVSVAFYAYYFPDYSAYFSLATRWSIWWFLCTLLSYFGLATMLGYAQTYIKSTPAWMRTANQLIFPFYILHQTVIVIIAFFVVQLTLPVWLKASVVLSASFLISAGLCKYLIYKFDALRFLFGLKPRH
ncbi:acyltransferase family protein [Ningiella sp. W23]|uniref:acyltransferase family protein n=1 Tax=Ningiella sp. W23 TaxID=3023715 RepID=UPI0039F5EECA